MRLTIPGPNLTTKKPRMRKRTTRPLKMADMNKSGRISKTPAASKNSLNGVGGGSIAGTIMAKNS